jgi:Galactosyltransferase
MMRGIKLLSPKRLLCLLVLGISISVFIQYYLGLSGNHRFHKDELHQREGKHSFLAMDNFFLPPPKPSNQTIVIFVVSNISRWEQRNTIRMTWAMKSTNVYFLITRLKVPLLAGNKVNTDHIEQYRQMRKNERLLLSEHNRFRDLLLIDDQLAKDAYGYCLKHWFQTEWIAMVWDGMYVHTNRLERYLNTFSPERLLVIGSIIAKERIVRNSTLNLYLSGIYYPPYPQTSYGYVVSRRLANNIIAQKELHVYQGDPGKSLGVWIENSKLNVTFQYSFGTFLNLNDCNFPNFVIMGSQLSADQIHTCYTRQGITSPPSSYTANNLTWIDSKISKQNVIILVLSNRQALERRTAIRRTWAQGFKNVYFVLSEACPYPTEVSTTPRPCIKTTSQLYNALHQYFLLRDEENLIIEQMIHQDIIISEKYEDHLSLPNRLKGGISFVVQQHLPSWIVVVRDKSYIRIDQLIHYLPSDTEDMQILGSIVRDEEFINSSQLQSSFIYSENTYPPFPKALNGYALSRQVAEFIAHNSSLVEYQYDDLSLGVWMRDHSVTWRELYSFRSDGDCEDDEGLIIGYGVEPLDMHDCFRSDRFSSLRSNWTQFRPNLSDKPVVVIVLSGRENFERRMTIRETWAMAHDNVYFVVGDLCPIPPSQRKDSRRCEADTNKELFDEVFSAYISEEIEALKEEEAEFHDIIFVNHPESYISLPYKLKEAYTWIVENTKARWVVKVDDDFFVRVNGLSRFIMTLDDTKPTVLGRIKPHNHVFKTGKWAEFQYKPKFYPNFPIGSCGHAVSRSVAEYVAKHRKNLIDYQGEDTSLGIWLDESALDTNWLTTSLFDNSGRCTSPEFFIVGHNISPEKMRICQMKTSHTNSVAAQGDCTPVMSRHKTLHPIQEKKEETVVSALSNAIMAKLESLTKSSVFNSSLAVIVLSLRGNSHKRRVIRQTWALGHQHVYFIVGEPCLIPKEYRRDASHCASEILFNLSSDFTSHIASQKQALRHEQETYGDMITINKPESYRSLVYNIKEAIDWIVRNTNVDWILKADDDTFVRIGSIVRYLSILSPTVPRIVGRIISSSKVWKSGKWADKKYNKTMYPQWPMGSCGYVISRPVAEYIASKKHRLFNYQGEDTSMGIWLDESSIRSKIVWLNSKGFVNHGECSDPKAVVIGHLIAPPKMKRCYRAMDETDYPISAIADTYSKRYSHPLKRYK